MTNNTQGKGRKRGYKLDLEDMERRIVDFRVTLDRERRRCQEAQMIDKYEKLLRDKLGELNQAGEPAADGRPALDNEIKLTTLDLEGSNRLANFLKYTIEMCVRRDQQELIEDVFRRALGETRLKRFREDPESVQARICHFCASSLDGPTGPPSFGCPVNHAEQSARVISLQLPAPILAHHTCAPDQPQSDQLGPDQLQPTPPGTAQNTPEVGEQAATFTPAPANLPTPAPTPDVQPAKGRPSKTNASSARPKAGAAGQDIVMASDSDSDSDDRSVASFRDVLYSAADSSRAAEPAERRCSTPVDQSANGTMPGLIIDESARARASPIKKPAGKSLKSAVPKCGAAAPAGGARRSSASQPAETSLGNLSRLQDSFRESAASQTANATANTTGPRTKHQPKRRNIANRRP